MQILNLTRNNIFTFLNNGKIKSTLFLNSDKYDVINEFGNPPNHNPQRKKNKEIMGYGALNIYLFNDKIVGFSINALTNYLNNTILEKLYKSEIIEFLNNNEIVIDKAYFLDDIEFIDIHNKKLGFLKDVLCYISVGI
ncbi:hypothetical protein [Neisseria yangbaofengii]|uniref:hypothetical protein n=1 Tax=Neisseria yangbaofengii TaxID=2709396 RepID=UPI0013EB44D4|nr:hypothetical protein [Neisseria yangbaofengii]